MEVDSGVFVSVLAGAAESDLTELSTARARSRAALFGEVDDAEPDPPRLGRFSLQGRLGRGGMGSVYLAHDPVLDRSVAVKILHRFRAHQWQAAAHLLAEAAAMAKLHHPNVVRVYDVGIDADVLFVAMEYVDGRTLRAWRAEHTRGWREILAAYLQAGGGVAAIHRAGLVHGDFKPDNVLVRHDGSVLVTDLAVAGVTPGDDTRVGTAEYMAPEQSQGAHATAPSDQYAFCVALCEALTGERPGPAQGRGARVPGIPAALRDSLVRGLQADPARRFPDMETLLHALARPARRRKSAAVAALVGVTAAASLAVAVLADDAIDAFQCRLGFAESCVAIPEPEPVESMRQRVVRARKEGKPEGFETFEGAYRDVVTRLVADAALGRVHPGAPTCLERVAAIRGAVGEVGIEPQHVDLMLDMLPDPTGCLDESEAEELRRGARSRRDLVLANALRLDGHHDRAREIVDAVHARVEADEDVANRALAELLRGFLIAPAQPHEARRAYDAAITLADATNDNELLLLAVNQRMQHAMAQGEHWSVLEGYANRAVMLASRLGNMHRLMVAHLMLGYVSMRKGDAQAAMEYHQAALDLGESVLGPRHREVAYAHDFVGAAYAEQGMVEPALEHKRMAIEILEEDLGRDHPDLATLLITSANIHEMVGRRAPVRAMLERALALRVEHFDEHHPRVGQVRGNLASWHAAEGDLETARQLWAVEIGHEEHPERRRHARLGWARALVQHERYADALTVLDEVATSDTLEGSPRDRSALLVLRALARAGAGGELADAADDAHSALNLAMGLDNSRFEVLATMAIAEVELARGRVNDADAHAERLEELVADTRGMHVSTLSMVAWVRVRVARALGRPNGELEAEAVRLVRAAKGPSHPQRRRVEAALGGHDQATLSP